MKDMAAGDSYLSVQKSSEQSAILSHIKEDYVTDSESNENYERELFPLWSNFWTDGSDYTTKKWKA